MISAVRPSVSPKTFLANPTAAQLMDTPLLAMPALRPHVLGDGESLFQKTLEHQTDGPRLLGIPVGILHLTEELGSAAANGTVAGSHPEEVTDRLAAAVERELGSELVTIETGETGKEALSPLPRPSRSRRQRGSRPGYRWKQSGSPGCRRFH